MRPPHLLDTVSKSVLPARVIFFDSESHVKIEYTDDDIDNLLEYKDVFRQHTPYLVCASFVNLKAGKKATSKTEETKDYYERTTGENFLFNFYQDVENFARWRERTYIFAHNAKYDTLVTGMIPSMVSLGYEVEGFSDSNPFILRLSKKKETDKVDKRTGKPIVDKKTIVVLSSTNYYQTSLKKLGDVFGLKKLDFTHGQPFAMEDAIIYCRRDVEILSVAMQSLFSFVGNNQLGNFMMTIAGQSFQAFRARFMHHNIWIHSQPHALEVERRTYAGGRNEVWTMGKISGKVYGVDVNSMYPSVMIENVYPVKLVTFRRTLTLQQIKKLLDAGYLLCCDALVKTDVPIFHLKQERLIFPTGQFWTSLSTPEIIEGLKRGIILRVKNIAVYEGQPIFREYVTYFYNKRLDAKLLNDEVHNFLYKLMLNSLYGKFGQKNVKWEKIDDAPVEEVRTEKIHVVGGKPFLVKVFGGGVFKETNDPSDEEAYHSFPAVAAHVTAYARMMLWRYIEIAGLDNVHYMDTDSLFVNLAGYLRLRVAGVIHDSKLGALAYEKCGYMKTHGCKDYVFLDRTSRKFTRKIKGVSGNAKEIKRDEEGRLRFIVTQWSGYSASLRKKDMQGYENRLLIKTLQRKYEKGNILSNGRVEPFKILSNIV